VSSGTFQLNLGQLYNTGSLVVVIIACVHLVHFLFKFDPLYIIEED